MIGLHRRARCAGATLVDAAVSVVLLVVLAGTLAPMALSGRDAAAPLPEHYLNLSDSRRVLEGFGASVNGDMAPEAVREQIRRISRLWMRINPAIVPEFFAELDRLQNAKTGADKARRAGLLARAGYFLQEKDMPELLDCFKRIANPGPRDAGSLASTICVAAARGVKAGQDQLRQVSVYDLWDGLSAELSRQEKVQLYGVALRELSWSPDFPEVRRSLRLSGFSETEEAFLKKMLVTADTMHEQYKEAEPEVYADLPEWHQKRNLSGDAPWLVDVDAPSILPPEKASETTKTAEKAFIPVAAPADLSRRELSTGDRLTVKTLATEGASAFGRLIDMVFAGHSELLFEQVLDNGKPVSEARKTKGFDGFVQAIQEQKALLEEVKTKGLLDAEKYDDFHIDLRLDVRMKQIPVDETTPVAGHEDVTLLFRIPNTSDVFKKHIPKIGGAIAELTVAEGGDLQVYMKRINGIWYWNPFGW